MKIINLLNLIYIIFLFSCNKENNLSQSEKIDLNKENNITLKYSNEIERTVILEKLGTKLIEDIYLKENFDSNFEVAAATFEEDKLNKTITLKYGVINIGNMTTEELTYTVIGNGLMKNKSKIASNSLPSSNDDASIVENKTKLKHTCNGGKFNGKTLTLDRPTGPASAYKYGKAVAKFSEDCLDNGGCVTVCKVNMMISIDDEELIFNNDFEKDGYSALLDSTAYILLDSLNKE